MSIFLYTVQLQMRALFAKSEEKNNNKNTTEKLAIRRQPYHAYEILSNNVSEYV